MILATPMSIWMAPLIALKDVVLTKQKYSLAYMEVARWKLRLTLMKLQNSKKLLH